MGYTPTPDLGSDLGTPLHEPVPKLQPDILIPILDTNLKNWERICATTASQNFEQRNHPSIEILPDESLFEEFKRLPSAQERSVCACVSKRWLMLLSNIHKDQIAESNGIEGEGYLARSLFGREATYVRLASIAIGTANHGGLAKLSIQGNNPCLSVTDVRLRLLLEVDLLSAIFSCGMCLLLVIRAYLK
ncbi:hypothetical protein MTR67_026320 [Solanum verrucosum]|uniref:F-box domain-containing protein n=1 Tax=Solanum verrucosum TaxID=315347 RepID=A0AAF0TZ56_SOLVR|nr:hypothetical protein MTR67_026320 [Solanum verrucosum]